MAIYSRSPESKDAVSVTVDRKGNKPVRLLFVDMEDALKAGHAVESVKLMQFCAIAVGIVLASRAVVVVARRQ